MVSFSFPDIHHLLPGDGQKPGEVEIAKDLNGCSSIRPPSVSNDNDKVITSAVGTVQDVAASDFNSSVQKKSFCEGGGSDTRSGILRSYSSPDRNAGYNCIGRR